MEFINLRAQYAAYKGEIDAKIAEILESAHFIMGAAVADFEREAADYCGAKQGVGCSSGTSALVLTLMALGVGRGDEVITSPFSFIASAEAILLLGAKPVFVDIDEADYNLDAKLLESAITPRTKAIIPVSLFGQMADLRAINNAAGEIPVIEDAAQSFGASCEGRKSCSQTTLAATSFFPSKPLGCYGDGGAVFTSDEALAGRIRCLLNHGQTERYKHSFIGFNARLDAIQAAILSVKLKHLDEEIRIRQKKAKIYDENLKNVLTPRLNSGNLSVYAQYSIRSKNRAALIARLERAHIPYAVHYPIPLHLQEAILAHCDYKRGDFCVSERVAEEILSLPFSAFLSESDQAKVIECVNG